MVAVYKLVWTLIIDSLGVLNVIKLLEKDNLGKGQQLFMSFILYTLAVIMHFWKGSLYTIDYITCYKIITTFIMKLTF